MIFILLFGEKMKRHSNYKFQSKYFKQYFHFKNYGGIVAKNKRLRQACSLRRRQQWNRYVVSMIEQVPEEAVSKNLLEIYK
jgi:hypothetical protein